MDISERIKAIRKEKKITQSEIAERIGLKHQSNYARLENRGNKLSYEEIQKFASALGVSVQYLLFGEEQKDCKEYEEKAKQLSKQMEQAIELKNLYRKILKDSINILLSSLIDETAKFISVFYSSEKIGNDEYKYSMELSGQLYEEIIDNLPQRAETFKDVLIYVFRSVSLLDLDFFVENNLLDNDMKVLYEKFREFYQEHLAETKNLDVNFEDLIGKGQSILKALQSKNA